MAQIFISYATRDRALADDWRRWLAGKGHEVFVDQDLHDGIAVGEDWRQRLFERLRWADAVLCIVTSAYLASVWCTAEVAIALARGSRLLPVRAEGDVVHPLLRFTQYADQVADPGAARAAVGAALDRVDAAGGLGWPDDWSPFPGLRPFEAELHRVFFGRRAETETVAGLLRSPPEPGGQVVLVVGPSGSGKSSLVRAGVRPILAQESDWWTLEPLLPGSAPQAALTRELSVAARRLGLGWNTEQVRDRLPAGGGLTAVAEDLLLACPGPQVRRHLLVVVDQFEELLRVAPSAERRQFAALLRPALAGPVRVVAALRTEFLGQLLSNAELADLPVRMIELRPVHRDALPAVVEGPAGLAGIAVEDGLVSRMVADTGSGEALPLLAYALAELAVGVRHGGRLSVARYEQLGGVRGALIKQAQAALMDAVAASGRTDREVISGLLRLVAVDDQGRPSRRRINRDELPEPVRAELDAFVARRLVSTDAEDGAVVVGVAHERFLSEWPPLADVITAQVSALRARQAVERAAEEWHVAGRPARPLWERGQLAAAVTETGARVRHPDRRGGASAAPWRRGPLRWLPGGGRVLHTDKIDINPQARAFLLASIRRDRRRRRRATTVLSALLLMSLAATGYAVRQDREAVRQRDIALSRQVASEADGLRRTDSSLAMQLALAAYRIAPTAQSRSSLLSFFAGPSTTRLQVHGGPILSVAVRPDGRVAATGGADHAVRLSDLGGTRPAVRATLAGHREWVFSVRFSPDGRTLASGGDDRTVRLWDLADPRHPARLLLGHTGGVRSIAFSPDGRTLASGGDDGTVRLWELRARAGHAHATVLTGHTDTVNSVAFSPDGRILASGSFDRTIRLWNVGHPGRPVRWAVLAGHDGLVQSVAFSPGGRMLASGSNDRTVRVWDVATGRVVGSYAQPTTVNSVTFGPDRDRLVAGGADGTLRWWDVATPVPTDVPAAMAASPSGRVLVTGAGGSLRTWDITDIYHPAALGDRDSLVTAAAFSADGRVLATGDADNAVRLWDMADPSRPAAIGGPRPGHISTVTTLAFSSDSRFLASGSRDAAIRLWVVGNRGLVRRDVLGSFRVAVQSVAFNPVGNTVASGGADGVKLWSIAGSGQAASAGTLGSPSDNYVGSIAFSPDGRLLAVGSRDAVQLWDVMDERSTAAFAPRVVARSGATVAAVAISRDGNLLATGNEDRTIRLWDITDPGDVIEVATLTGHTGTVRSLAFTPGGVLVAADDGGAARLWDTGSDRVGQRVCAVAGSPITPTEWKQYIPDLPYDPPCS